MKACLPIVLDRSTIVVTFKVPGDSPMRERLDSVLLPFILK